MSSTAHVHLKTAELTLAVSSSTDRVDQVPGCAHADGRVLLAAARDARDAHDVVLHDGPCCREVHFDALTRAARLRFPPDDSDARAAALAHAPRAGD